MDQPHLSLQDYTLKCPDPEMTRIARKIIELSPVRLRAVAGGWESATAVRTPVALARLGLGEELPVVLDAYSRAFNLQLPNGLSTFECGDSSIEHLGIITMTLQEGLMQSVSPRPGEPEIIRVFPAWPKKWDGAFSLVARGGFLVTSERRQGIIAFVEIESRLGERCRIRNPWNTACFLQEEGQPKRSHTEDIIQFDTSPGKRYRLFSRNIPARRRIVPASGLE